jgi:hypothetical protein
MQIIPSAERLARRLLRTAFPPLPVAGQKYSAQYALPREFFPARGETVSVPEKSEPFLTRRLNSPTQFAAFDEHSFVWVRHMKCSVKILVFFSA